MTPPPRLQVTKTGNPSRDLTVVVRELLSTSRETDAAPAFIVVWTAYYDVVSHKGSRQPQDAAAFDCLEAGILQGARGAVCNIRPSTLALRPCLRRALTLARVVRLRLQTQERHAAVDAESRSEQLIGMLATGFAAAIISYWRVQVGLCLAHIEMR